MRELKKAGFSLCLGLVLLVLTGFGAKRAAAPGTGSDNEMARHIALLKSGKPQQKAAAAYWLGQQHNAAALAVDPLLELLRRGISLQQDEFLTELQHQRNPQDVASA